MSDLGRIWKIFWSDPIKAITDPDGAALAYSVKEKLDAGVSVVVVETELENAGFQKGGISLPIVDDLVSGISGVFNGVTDTVKNLPLYIFLIIGFLGVYVILMGRKGKAII